MMRTKHRLGTACGLALALGPAVPDASAQRYTLDDWMTVSSVGSFEWSPDGAYIYYTSNAAESGTDEIFRIRRDGSDRTQVSVNPAGERPEPKSGPVLSTDGRTIYFTSARYFQSYDNIFRMPATGGPATALTFNDGVIQIGRAHV